MFASQAVFLSDLLLIPLFEPDHKGTVLIMVREGWVGTLGLYNGPVVGVDYRFFPDSPSLGL